MQLGFVIDHSRCIGCHACTVACKSENDVPLGQFRTWVKYTERGEFPEVRRSFAVLRCNQCSDAPCVTICPVRALEKRPDGIVDVDPAACIGCKACMQACPYDALYINGRSGTAEKCHFCAHRVEVGLAPACAIVCPTEAIIPGDFHDSNSVVSQLRKIHDLTARKTEAGTQPNVFYRDVDVAGIEPAETNIADGFLWAQAPAGPQQDAQLFEKLEQKAKARTVYDVEHPPLWGSAISAYLFTKSLAAGVFLAGLFVLPPFARTSDGSGVFAIPLLALILLGITSAVLVADLKRPERFYYILTRPNFSSWLTRGTFFLAGYGALLSIWLIFGLFAIETSWLVAWILASVTAITAVFSAVYTGWLFEQAKGRPLWMRRGYWVQLLVQALMGGSALILIVRALTPALGFDPLAPRLLLIGSIVAQLAFVLFEGRLAPPRRKREHHRALRLISHGPFSKRHWRVGVALGHAVPLLFLLIPGAGPIWAVASLLALVGLFVEEDLFVRAGQALPIS